MPEALTAVSDTGLRTMAKTADGWCVALDRTTHRCGIYAIRPDACRRFVMGAPYCLAVREDAGMTAGYASPASGSKERP